MILSTLILGVSLKSSAMLPIQKAIKSPMLIENSVKQVNCHIKWTSTATTLKNIRYTHPRPGGAVGRIMHYATLNVTTVTSDVIKVSAVAPYHTRDITFLGKLKTLSKFVISGSGLGISEFQASY